MENRISSTEKSISSKLLSISAFGKLTGIDRRTLIFYDRIGLLKPVVRNEKQYRYYARSQVNDLCIILTLQELGMSLNQIIEIQNKRSPGLLSDVFERQSAVMDQRIRRLLCTKDMLSRRQEDLHILSNACFDIVRFVDLETQYYYVSGKSSGPLNVAFDETWESFYESCLENGISQGYPISYFIESNIPFMGEIETVEQIGFHLGNPDFSNFIVPTGSFAVMFHQGSFPGAAIYDQLRSAICKGGYVQNGAWIIDTMKDEVYTTNEQEFIYRCVIPITKQV